jgi:predicted aldo/keto reductase-like oxidoreductase
VGVECGVCVERCPFDVEIIERMREAATVFETATA